jgi:hypothetical protein
VRRSSSSGRGSFGRAGAGQPEDGRLAGGELLEGLGAEAADRLAAHPAGRDEPGGAEPTDVPRHERLRQPDLGDEVGDAGLRAGETPDDPEPVDVGQCLVDEAELAEVVGLEDRVRDRAPDMGAGWTQEDLLGGRGAVGSTAIYINAC